MAIKGKGRTRGRRMVAAPPRRQLVVRKPPIWRRRSVLAAVGLVVLAGILWGALTAIEARRDRARTERETAAVQRFFNRVQAEFPAEILPVPPDLVVIFPSVSQDLPRIGADIPAREARSKGRDVAAAARSSADGTEAIPTDDLIPAEFAGVRATLSDAQFLMAQAFRLYERIGALMRTAAGLSGEELQGILNEAQELTSHAGALFDRGYGKLVRVANRLGISTTVIPQPTPSPSPTGASPSPEPSPSPSPST
jgi:hypothetical protein